MSVVKRYLEFVGPGSDYYRSFAEHVTKFATFVSVYSSEFSPASISGRLGRVSAPEGVSSDLKNCSLSTFQPVFQLNGSWPTVFAFVDWARGHFQQKLSTDAKNSDYSGFLLVFVQVRLFRFYRQG